MILNVLKCAGLTLSAAVIAAGRAEGQLPRLEVAPPDDRQIVCITPETNTRGYRE
jgi:hypothetical protein